MKITNWDASTASQVTSFDGVVFKIYYGSHIPVTTGEFEQQTS